MIIARGLNPEKEDPGTELPMQELVNLYGERILFYNYPSLLVDAITALERDGYPVKGIIRGLRNGHDLQYEMNQQYWCEDLGLSIPMVYFITDRKLSHISSSSIRQIDKFRRIK